MYKDLILMNQVLAFYSIFCQFCLKKPKRFYSFYDISFVILRGGMDAMSDVIRSFGNNAGKLWKTLSDEGPQVRSKLLDSTQLTKDEFYGAIGWLAREDKVRKDKRTYKIGNTNLTDKIGEDAGKVWSVLQKRNDIDVSAIARTAKVTKRDCYSALGWLAREGKITAKIAVRKK